MTQTDPALRLHAVMLGPRDLDGVQAAFARFGARGVTFLNEPHLIDGTNYVANSEDPDRHLFSLYGAP